MKHRAETQARKPGIVEDASVPRRASSPVLRSAPRRWYSTTRRSKVVFRTFLFLCVVCLLGLMLSLVSWEARPPVLPITEASFKNVDESVMPPVVIRSSDQVCAVCTDGLVYVHLGRPAAELDNTSGAPQLFTIAEELYVQPRTSPVFTAGRGSWWSPWLSSSEVVSRCLAQLVALGQIGSSQKDPVILRAQEKPLLTVAVVVDYDSAGTHTSIGSLTGQQCPNFLTEVRPTAQAPLAGGTVKMDVSYPRLPSWPLPSALYPTAQGDNNNKNNNNNAGVRGPLLPPYFGTAAVRETDVDKDVLPPLSVTLAQDRQSIRIRFGEDATSTRPEAFEMACSSYFLTVRIGRFGRQHNQVQEMMNTLAFAHRVNRTFIVPVLVPEWYVLYLRYDAQKVYGFNALRREGGYCLLTYPEARAILKEMASQKKEMTLRRFNYYGDPEPEDKADEARIEVGDWWVVPPLSDPQQPRVYNVDAWLEDSAVRQPPVTMITDSRTDGMHFNEVEDEFVAQDVFPTEKEHQRYVRMAAMRLAAAKMIALLGGDHTGNTTTAASRSQPRLGILSSRMAFYLHPSLVEQTRLMGLLRPSPHLSADLDRFYAAHAAEFAWPQNVAADNAAAAPPPLRDTLRPSNLKRVIGYHVRRREGTCSDEARSIGATAYPIDERFQLDKRDPSWSSPLSTLRNMELDCGLTASRLVQLYTQHTRWLRENASGLTAGESAVPTIYMAYDDESKSVAEGTCRELSQLARSAQRTRVWGNATTFPRTFLSAYDNRSATDFHTLYDAAVREMAPGNAGGARDADFSEEQRVALVRQLYDPTLAEMTAMAADFFMLTNTGVFRGVMLSSVSINVIMRRWGRGLPCHALLPGYLPSLYAAMWTDY